MVNRITRHQMFMDIAQVVAKRSTCMRLNVGAVLVKDRNILSMGYNGVKSGEAHCAGNSCPGKWGCQLTTHAEVNALIRAPKESIKDSDLYVTDSPCHNCASLAFELGVCRIFFAQPYRITGHLDGYPSRIFRVLPAGYVLDWSTKELIEDEG